MTVLWTFRRPSMRRPFPHQFMRNELLDLHHYFSGLDHGVGHFRPLSITRQRHLLAYHGTAMSHEGLCQVF